MRQIHGLALTPHTTHRPPMHNAHAAHRKPHSRKSDTQPLPWSRACSSSAIERGALFQAKRVWRRKVVLLVVCCLLLCLLNWTCGVNRAPRRPLEGTARNFRVERCHQRCYTSNSSPLVLLVARNNAANGYGNSRADIATSTQPYLQLWTRTTTTLLDPVTRTRYCKRR